MLDLVFGARTIADARYGMDETVMGGVRLDVVLGSGEAFLGESIFPLVCAKKEESSETLAVQTFRLFRILVIGVGVRPLLQVLIIPNSW